jgi:hypothetical protein
LATDERTDLSRGANDDVIVTDVKRRGEKMTRVINIYDQRDVRTMERQARKINWSRIIRQRGGGTILVGKFNPHSCRWDPRCMEQQDAIFWEEIIDEHRLEIRNHDQPTHHWARNGEEGEWTIDLTLASRPITRRPILDRRHATGSDPQVMEWEFSIHTQEEADHMQVIGCNLAAKSKDDEKVAEKLWKELAGQRARLDEECTGDEVEREAKWCQEMLSKVLDAKAKKIRICAQTKRWWNGEIKERRSTLGREKRRGRRSEAAAHTNAELQRSIRQSKSCMWNEYLLNLRGGRGLGGWKVRQPSSGSHRGSADQQSGKSSKHHGRHGANGQRRVLPNERWRSVLRATPTRPSPRANIRAISRTSPILAIGQEIPWPRQAVLRSHAPTLEVE